MPADPAGRPLDPPGTQAEVFRSLRRAHSMETTEDYVELIGDLIDTRGEARLVELAERLGISQPTAGKTVARLQREGFVTSEPYRSIFLTEKGRALADRTRARHDVVYRFFVAIGVAEETARRDSEGVEHHVSDETLAAFERIIAARSTTDDRPHERRDRGAGDGASVGHGECVGTASGGSVRRADATRGG